MRENIAFITDADRELGLALCAGLPNGQEDRLVMRDWQGNEHPW